MTPNVSCKFFGNTSIYIDDGTTHIFIDAFFSRPALEQGASSLTIPDLERIQDTISRGKLESLDAIFVAHSHWDHAMDAPEVTKRLGGKMYGSNSTLNIGRGQGLDEDSMQLIADGKAYTVGSFNIHIFEGIHSPGNMFPGTIDAPLHASAKASDLRDGGCFSFHITHPSGNIFVHPSANFVASKFQGLDVDVFYLGIGLLGKQSRQFQDDYWRETIEATKPRLIIPVHWDNLFEPLKESLEPLPEKWDSFQTTKRLLEEKQSKGWNIQWQELFEVIHSQPLESSVVAS